MRVSSNISQRSTLIIESPIPHSLQPPHHAFLTQVGDGTLVGNLVSVDVAIGVCSGLSLQPNQPCVWQDVVVISPVVVAETVEGTVMLGGSKPGSVGSVSSPSLQPNQPGVLQVVVEVVVVVVSVEVEVMVTISVVVELLLLVVVSSRQPHQPGVLHVDVLVVLVIDFDEVVVDVIGSE